MGKIIELIDSYTKENVNYEETAVWLDGSPMDDTKVDNVIYRKREAKYYRRCYNGPINVKWFGAIGDGISDDTTAIQKAIDYSPNFAQEYSTYGGGAVIYVPTGVYKITSTIHIKSKIYLCIRGDGKQATTFKNAASNNIVFHINPDADIKFGKGFSFENLTIKSDRKAFSNSSGIRVGIAHLFSLKNCTIEGFTNLNTNSQRLPNGSYNIQSHLDGNYGIMLNHVISSTIIDCEISFCGAGIVYNGWDGFTTTVPKIINSFINYCGYGLYIHAATTKTIGIYGSTFEANYSPGVGISANECELSVQDCWFELNNYHMEVSRNARISVFGTNFSNPRPSFPPINFINPIANNNNQHTFINSRFNVPDATNNGTIYNALLIGNKVDGVGVLVLTYCTNIKSGGGIDIDNIIKISPTGGVISSIEAKLMTNGQALYKGINSANESSVSGASVFEANSTSPQSGLRALSAKENGVENAYITTSGRSLSKQLFIKENEVPTLNIANHAALFIEGGVLKVKLSNGTIKTVQLID